jgi:hypothetical protein
VTKVNIVHQGKQIAEVSVDVCVSESITAQQAIQLMGGLHVSLEVKSGEKQIFINATNFALLVMQLLQGEKVPCVPPSI